MRNPLLWIYERPRAAYRRNVSSAAQELITWGIVKLPRYFGGGRLKVAQERFNQAIDGVSADSSGKLAFHREHAAIFQDMIRDEGITRIAEQYWGKPVGTPDFHGFRLLPTETVPDDYGAYHWHRDHAYRELRAMILLTDVTSRGQCMQYQPGSQWGGGEARAPIWGDGEAGTVILFDVSGLHKGNRSLGPARDVLLPRYVATGALRYFAHEVARPMIRFDEATS